MRSDDGFLNSSSPAQVNSLSELVWGSDSLKNPKVRPNGGFEADAELKMRPDGDLPYH